MAKFCSNCGKEINENAIVCLGCGAAVDSRLLNLQMPNKPKIGRGIASMVLGIIALFYEVLVLIGIDTILNTYYSHDISYAFGTILLQSSIAIISLCLSVSERKQNKNGFNAAGFWLSIATLILCMIQFVIVL